jgi:hypothetical protein
MIAPMPVPVGWEQLPVTEGIFREESTKIKAPATARTGNISRLKKENLSLCSKVFYGNGQVRVMGFTF